LDVQDLLVVTLEILLTSGVGGAIIVGYATKDLFLTEEKPLPEGSRFSSDYQELMWLADKQRHHLSEEETHRFYELRHNWSEMHSFNQG
jgi:hypothetical protein